MDDPDPLVDVPPAAPDGALEELYSTWAILILITMLFSILLMSYYFQSKRIHFLHESVVSIFLGIMVGLVVRFVPDESFAQLMMFDHRYFFNLLLPPILLNSGYDLKRKNFFRNFGSILMFALVGTFLSTVFIGIVVWLFVGTGIYGLQLSFLECIQFGAIMSSTDPVTVLAIFHQLRVDPQLFAIIFGESMLNDSVAIVLSTVLKQYRGKHISLGNILHGVGTFLAVFWGSVAVGILMALMCAIMLKHSRLYKYQAIESSLITLVAYSSYLLSNGCQLSGIVSLLFCGISLRHYAYDNMSRRTRRTTKYMFRVLSQLSENFIFIYLGLTVFVERTAVYLPLLILWTLLALMAARYISVIPIARLINTVSTNVGRGEAIPRNHQIMLWWSGLRGAVAFALSFEFEGPNQNAIRTTTLVTCIVSVIALGGTTHAALRRLNIRIGVGSTPGRIKHRSAGGMRHLHGGQGMDHGPDLSDPHSLGHGHGHSHDHSRDHDHDHHGSGGSLGPDAPSPDGPSPSSDTDEEGGATDSSGAEVEDWDDDHADEDDEDDEDDDSGGRRDDDGDHHGDGGAYNSGLHAILDPRRDPNQIRREGVYPAMGLQPLGTYGARRESAPLPLPPPPSSSSPSQSQSQSQSRQYAPSPLLLPSQSRSRSKTATRHLRMSSDDVYPAASPVSGGTSDAHAISLFDPLVLPRLAGQAPRLAHHWFISFDEKWLKPVFSRSRTHARAAHGSSARRPPPRDYRRGSLSHPTTRSHESLLAQHRIARMRPPSRGAYDHDAYRDHRAYRDRRGSSSPPPPPPHDSDTASPYQPHHQQPPYQQQQQQHEPQERRPSVPFMLRRSPTGGSDHAGGNHRAVSQSGDLGRPPVSPSRMNHAA